jgi:glycosyltransferase involved in cell wall biosynthesis
MNREPLVSIITPFLNTKKYFEECIESVLKQTYNNWELMLVDDGSSDGSTEIAKHYAGKYPDKIFYLEHENHQNRGASASRNLGIRTSKGRFIAFLDSDDIYMPRKLEDQVALLQSQPGAGMLYAATEYWYSWSGLPEDSQKDFVWKSFGVEPDTLVPPPDLLTMFLQDGGTVPCMGSVLVRREAIESVGGWENVFRYIYTDQVFHAKICFNWPVFVASGCWDKYRQHPDSSCHIVVKTNQSIQARLNYLTWLEQYLVENGGNKNRRLWAAFRKAMRPYKHKYLHKLLLLKGAAINKIRSRIPG